MDADVVQRRAGFLFSILTMVSRTLSGATFNMRDVEWQGEHFFSKTFFSSGEIVLTAFAGKSIRALDWVKLGLRGRRCAMFSI